MSMATYTRCAIGLAVALALSATAQAGAQDTTRRATSQKRIPVSKEQGGKVESRGEVALPVSTARISELEATAAALNTRIEALERSNASLTSKSAENERLVYALNDSLRMVRGELVSLRSQLASANARVTSLSDQVQGLSGRFTARNSHPVLFGNTGFYIGAGTGANLVTNSLSDIGYRPGLNVTVPIGWSKPGYPIGVRAEFGVQGFNGKSFVPGFVNQDPMIYSGTAMLTLHLPMNTAKDNFIYLMGGGGAFRFRDMGTQSALNDHLGGGTSSVTKFGVTGGAGVEFKILGATSLFAQTAFTNVFGEKSIVGNGTSKNIQWVPLVAGLTLR